MAKRCVGKFIRTMCFLLFFFRQLESLLFLEDQVFTFDTLSQSGKNSNIGISYWLRFKTIWILLLNLDRIQSLEIRVLPTRAEEQ